MQDIFYNFQKPQWEYKYGHIKFSSIARQKIIYLFRHQPFIYQKAYDQFYEVLKKYSDYDDHFKNAKNETALQIKEFIKGNKTLSWGCGTAYIEENNFPEEDITLMDYAKINSLGNRNIYGKEILNLWKGNCIIGIQLVCFMNESELYDFFSRTYKILVQEGILIITHTPRNNFFVDIFDITKNLIKLIFWRRETFIFWTFQRSDRYYEELAKNNGFNLISKKKNRINKENILIFKKI